MQAHRARRIENFRDCKFKKKYGYKRLNPNWGKKIQGLTESSNSLDTP